MIHRGAALAGAVVLLSGCVYYNAIYNAQSLFAEGERYRRAGLDSLSQARFRDVIRKAGRGFQADPDGAWADDALLLVGRSHQRLGNLPAARAALREALDRTDDPDVRSGATLLLGAAWIEGGDVETGLPMVNEGLDRLSSGDVLAEGHLWRGRVLLARGQTDAGWWDLDRAVELDDRARLEAALEKLGWAIRYGDRPRASESMGRLLSYREGAEHVETVVALTRGAADRWGAPVALDLLGRVEDSGWPRGARARLLVAQAELLLAAGDTAEAMSQAERAANGVGPEAVAARVRLARLHLERARDLVEVRRAERVLLPAERHPDVAALLEAVRLVSHLAEQGLSEPLAWFAAAEVARDDLRSRTLARGLFLAYADAAAEEPWAPKALLAALTTTPDEGSRSWLRGRLEARSSNPYVLAARGQPAPGIEALEEELADRLRQLTGR